MRLLLIITIWGIALGAQAQALYRNYNVLNGDDSVGFVKTAKKTIGDEEHYEVKSEITLTMIFKVKVDYSITAVYKHGVLQSSKAIINVNGSVRHRVEVEKSGESYDMVVDGDEQPLIFPVKASSATLYFQRPDGIADVFSETNGVIKSLSKLVTGQFQLSDRDKSSDLNTYTYAGNALLSEIVVERFLLPTLRLVYIAEAKYLPD